MKVNEVITEAGFWDAIKTGVQKIQARKAQKQANTAADQSLKRSADITFNDWSRYARNIPNRLSTPQAYQNEMLNWLKARYRNDNFEMPPNVTLPKTDALSVQNFLKQAEMQRAALPTSTAQQAQGAPGAQPSVSAAKVSPAVKIIDTEPAIIEFDKEKYELNDDGAWQNLRTHKVASSSVSAFLSKQHDIAIGVPPGTTAAQAKPTATNIPPADQWTTSPGAAAVPPGNPPQQAASVPPGNPQQQAANIPANPVASGAAPPITTAQQPVAQQPAVFRSNRAAPAAQATQKIAQPAQPDFEKTMVLPATRARQLAAKNKPQDNEFSKAKQQQQAEYEKAKAGMQVASKYHSSHGGIPWKMIK